MKKEKLKHFTIPNRFNGSIIFEGKFASFKLCVEAAVKLNINLYSANLESANLESANLYSANLESANLESANLESANLYSANLKSANLKSANLKSANLESANLYSANLKSANLKSANLKSANLYSAKNIIAIHFFGFSMYIQKEMSRIGCEYRRNSEWIKMDIKTAIKLGIKKEHFEAYKTLGRAAIRALKTQHK